MGATGMGSERMHFGAGLMHWLQGLTPGYRGLTLVFLP